MLEAEQRLSPVLEEQYLAVALQDMLVILQNNSWEFTSRRSNVEWIHERQRARRLFPVRSPDVYSVTAEVVESGQT